MIIIYFKLFFLEIFNIDILFLYDLTVIYLYKLIKVRPTQGDSIYDIIDYNILI